MILVLLFLPLIAADVGARDPGLARDGLHVCITHQARNVSYSKSYVTSYRKKITTQCFTTEWERCSINRTFYRTAYRTAYRQQFIVVYYCCKGWEQRGIECPIPQCSQTCFHGNCTKPDTCSCEAGFQGPDCNKMCDLNHYGPGCNETCQCQNGAKCDSRNGACACAAGWLGKLCDLPCKRDQTSKCMPAGNTSILTTPETETTKPLESPARYPGLPSSPAFCEESSTGNVNMKGVFHWKKTPVGSSASLPCPYGPEGATASRMCVMSGRGSGSWQTTELRMCSYKTQVTEKLVSLSTSGVNASNARNVCRQVKVLVNETSGVRLSDVDISQTADIVQKIVDVRESLDQNGQDIVDIVDKIMDLNETYLEESQRDTNASTKFLKAINSLAENLPLIGNQTTRKLSSKNVAIQTTKIKISSFSGMSFSSTSEDGSKPDANIDLPKSLFQNQAASIQQETQIGFAYYRNSKLFQPVVGRRNSELFVNSRVIAASVRGVKLEGLTNPVKITLTPLLRSLTEQPSCVYWDFSSGGGRGNWSTRGCSLKESQPTGIECVCDHLTSFAVLMSPNEKSPATNKPPQPHDRILSVISDVGCAVSVAGVVLTLLTYLMFKPLRKSHVQTILIHLCFSLMLLLVVFLAGAERHDSTEACQCAAVALHYFLLTTVTWMSVEAYSMYLMFVKVMDRCPSRYILRCSVVAWGIPAVIVGITAGTATSYYGTGTSCVLIGLPFFVTQFTPVCLLLLFNFIVFILVLYHLGRGSIATPGQRTTSYQRLRIAATLAVLLGLTWLFGAMALALGSVTRAFEYLFCVFNSLQGFFIFYVTCLRQPEVRQNWAWFITGKGFKGWREKYIYSKTQTYRLYEIQQQTKSSSGTLLSVEKEELV